jgi:hypothetical protein
LAKYIRSSICKEQAETLTMDAVLSLIPKIFSLQSYGFLPSDFPSSSTTTVKIPAALQIRRWEAIEPEKWFTPEQCVTLEQRKTERQAARTECLRILGEMDDVEKWELLKGESKESKEKPEIKVDVSPYRFGRSSRRNRI